MNHTQSIAQHLRQFRNTDGRYPVYSWGRNAPTGEVLLKAGDVWKIGETIQYNAATGKQGRYAQSWLDAMNVTFVPEYTGPKSDIFFVQQMKLAQYRFVYGVLPPGNKGLK